MSSQSDRSEARGILDTSQGPVAYYPLERLERRGAPHLDRLPFSIRILLENVLRNQDGKLITQEDVHTVTAKNTTNSAAAVMLLL